VVWQRSRTLKCSRAERLKVTEEHYEIGERWTRMGKYSHLRGELEPVPQDPSYQSQVDKAKHQYNGLSVGKLGEAYGKHYLANKQLEAEIHQENLELEALRQMLVDAMTADGLDMVRLGDGSSLSMKDEPYSSVENRAAFHQWIKESGREHLLTVNYQSMNSLVKDLLLDGQPPPPGLKAFIKTSLTRRS
jgi:hypothetical protein